MKKKRLYLLLAILPLLLTTGCELNDIIRNPVVMVIIVIFAVWAAFKMQKK